MVEKKILIALIALMLNLTCFSGVLFVSAYYVSSDEKENNATVGDSKLNIVEDFQSPKDLIPGQTITKKVMVKNTGLCPSNVRVLVVFSDSNAQKNVRIQYDTDKWELRDDNYWYYKSTLKSGETTDCLFESVEISEGAAEEDLEGFEIIVYSECVDVMSGGF